AAPLHNRVKRDVTNLQHLIKLKLAHPVTEDDIFEISLLVFIWTLFRTKLYGEMALWQFNPKSDFPFCTYAKWRQ
ncbi:hypothetical protein BOV88_13715, partial [Solemya velum gill symbiont]